jgi:hypothetical protein
MTSAPDSSSDSSSTERPAHSDIIRRLIDAVEEQEAMMNEMSSYLNQVRTVYPDELQDIIDGQEVDNDAPSGTVAYEAAKGYLMYMKAMDYFQAWFQSTREASEKVWREVDMVFDAEGALSGGPRMVTKHWIDTTFYEARSLALEHMRVIAGGQ